MTEQANEQANEQASVPMPYSRHILEAREQQTLAPYASLSQHARREHPEEEGQTRTAFQKDRDRILHTTAFRRLEAKTQVFLNPTGDHYRTRLTHTLEVQQVARSVALSLGLNETLCEAIALAHDLGHPPFGHAGERLLNELMREAGGFDHNEQAQRIVTRLEDHYPDFLGLNLTQDTLDGLNKHKRQGLPRQSLEAQVVDAADALAYTAHDLDDGLRSGLLTPHKLQELALWQTLMQRMEHKHGGQWACKMELQAKERRLIHRELLSLLIEDLTAQSVAHIQTQQMAGQLGSSEAARQLGHSLIQYTPDIHAQMQGFRQFLHQHLYNHWEVKMQVEQAEGVLSKLFATYAAKPNLLPPRPRSRLEREGTLRTVCDHLAGMTDRHAFEIYKRLVP